jgi:hypothetical protein
MVLLLASCYDNLGTNPRASKKQARILPESRRRVESGQLCVRYVCSFCNSYKGSDIAGRDPKTRKLTPLFNPRHHKWSRHFRWQGATLLGRTAIGRLTVALLNINEAEALATREALIAARLFSPV